MTDWNPSDPDEIRVIYDLSAWSIDHQAELASDLADAEIPHHWDGSELMVPEDQEAATDLVIATAETRLGIEDSDFDDADARDAGDEAAADAELELPEPVELEAGAPTTEYDLMEWPPTDRMALTHALTRSGVAFRWEGQHVLLVDTASEEGVDALLDQIERGEYADGDSSAADADRLPFETLTTFFLAGERLRRDPLDADGLEQLLAAIELADPAHPPYGVQPRLWQRTCALAEALADALVGAADDDDAIEAATGADAETDAAAADADDADDDADDADDDVTAALDYDRAVATAEQLHDLLRPYV